MGQGKRSGGWRSSRRSNVQDVLLQLDVARGMGLSAAQISGDQRVIRMPDERKSLSEGPARALAKVRTVTLQTAPRPSDVPDVNVTTFVLWTRNDARTAALSR
jgi:hypothetical protein